MKLGRYVTVDDGGNYVTERIKKNCNPSQWELGLPVQCPALTSSIESYDKYLKTPQKRQMDNRNQARWVHLLNFIQKN